MDVRFGQSGVPAPPDDSAKFIGLAFKLWSDPFVGKLVFFRVYRGKLSKGDTIYNPRTRKNDRVSRLIQIQADKRDSTVSSDSPGITTPSAPSGACFTRATTRRPTFVWRAASYAGTRCSDRINDRAGS